MKTLIIITGTTKGIGKELESTLLSNYENYVLTINRHGSKNNFHNYTNLNIDLSNIGEKDITVFSTNIKNILTKYRLDRMVFVNNAFTIHPINTITELGYHDVINSCTTNIISAILLIKEFMLISLQNVIQRDIVNITSGAAKYPIKQWGIYCLSKASIEMFMKSITMEYENLFKTYNIDPGTIDTDMQKTIRKYTEDKYFDNLKKENLLKTPKSVALEILRIINL